MAETPGVSEDATRDLTARTTFVAVAILAMTASFVLIKSGRDALFFLANGIFDLPKAYIGIALLALPMALVTLGIMRTLGPRRARVIVPLVAAMAFAGFFTVVRPGGGLLMTFFFMLVPLVFGVLFSLSWLLAADLLDGAPRDRLVRAYSIIGAASILGGTLGGALAKLFASLMEPRGFLLVGAVLLAISAAVMAAAQRRFPLQMAGTIGLGANPRPSLADFIPLLRQRYSALLLAIGMTGALAGLLIEFQFYIAAATSGNTGRENAHFFANVYLVLNGAALVVQLLLLPPLQKRVGLLGGLLVLPLALLGGTSTLLANASIAVRSVLRVMEGGLKSSVHRVSWEQAYLPLSRAQRSLAKLLVDGAGARVAEGLGALIVYVWIQAFMVRRNPSAQDVGWVTYALLLAAALWLWLTRAIRDPLRAAVASADAESEFRLDIPLPDT